VTNLFANYTIPKPFAFSKQAKLQLGVNNLFNQQNITSVLAGGTPTSTSANPSPKDQLQILPERSVSVTLTVDF
jgi:iron complex outermembrane receptor protein